MGLFDIIKKKVTSNSKNHLKLTSSLQAAELICSCWENLDVSIIEPYLAQSVFCTVNSPLFKKYNISFAYDNMQDIYGRESCLKELQRVFDLLKYRKNCYRADIIKVATCYRACITFDDEHEDLMHVLTIEDGLINKILLCPSPEWWHKVLGRSSFGVTTQTSLHEQAAAVAAIENYVKTELGDKPITWATQYELRNSCCQLSFTCDGLSYDVLVEIHSFDDDKCRFVMYSEYNGLIAECKENDHIPCILALNEDLEFVSLTLLEDMDVRVQKLRNKGLNEWTFRGLFKTKAQLSRLIITKDYRILLPDYNDIEVKMEPLVKAVYLLFLKHPEGILFKGLTDYREELLDIYKKLKPTGLNKKTIQSIDDVTNPLLNSINEKCARIRSAFVKEFDEALAKNYFVTGERGEVKKISLPRDLVVWE